MGEAALKVEDRERERDRRAVSGGSHRSHERITGPVPRNL